MMKKSIILMFVLSSLISFRASAQKMDRGIDFMNSPTFVPEGTILFGGTISYLDYKFSNYKFLVVDGLNASGFTFKVSPYVSYFFRDNLAAGARFAYKRSLLSLSEVALGAAGVSFDLADFHTLQHTYYGSLTFRNYIPLGNSLRFGIFNEISLDFGAGQSKMVSGTGDTMSGTFQKIFEVGIGVTPGIVVFVANELAVEASIGIMGLDYKKVKQYTNQIFEGNYETSSADFKINLLSVNIGISFFLPLIKPKAKVKKSSPKQDSNA